MIKVDAMGDTCPIPVVKTKNAIKELQGAGEIEILVDNEIAVENLTKMAKQMKLQVSSKKEAEGKYEVRITVTDGRKQEQTEPDHSEAASDCIPCRKKNTVVVIKSNCMGEGDPVLGKTLLKGYIFAITQLEDLPSTILFYNGGASVTCEGSDSMEDLKKLAEAGVQILTCGTCLNYYGLSEKLAVGDVTNMYAIAEIMAGADLIVQP